MSTTVAKLQGGGLSLTGNVNERNPHINDNMKIRFIKESTNGSDKNTGNHLVEIHAINGEGINVALGKKVYAVSTGAYLGVKPTDNGTMADSTTYASYDSQGFILDLEDQYELQEIIIWHYHTDGRTYNDVVLEVSADGVDYTQIFSSVINGTYLETANGKVHKVPYLGLVEHYPFDGTLSRTKTTQSSKVAGFSHNATHRAWYDWFASNSGSFTNIVDFEQFTQTQALEYDLIIYDASHWAVPEEHISKLKEFTDAGVSCVARGNDTKQSVFVKSTVSFASTTNTTFKIEEDLPFRYNGEMNLPASPDVMHIATELTDIAKPLHGRSSDLITGYIYESKDGAVLVFDGEGRTLNDATKAHPLVLPFNIASFNYALSRSTGKLLSGSRVNLKPDGLHLEKALTNLNNLPHVFNRYNNYHAAMDISLLGETYNGHPIYRWSFTASTEVQLNSIKTTLGAQGVLSNTITFKGNTPYVSSVIWRPVNKQDTLVGGTASNINGWTELPNQVLRDGWRKSIVVRNGSVINDRTDSSFISVRVPSAVLNETIYVDLCCFQIEEGLYATDYTNTSRLATVVDIPFNLKPPYTINVYHKPNSLLSSVEDQPTSPKILQLGSYNSSASISLWNFMKFLKTYVRGDVSTSWSGEYQFHSYTSDEWDHTEHMYTIVARSPRLFEVFMDGSRVGVAESNTDATNINDIKFYTGINSDKNNSATYRDLSVYNIALSSDQIASLYKSPLSISREGNLHTNEVCEKPLKIPKDSLYFPLDSSSSDSKGILSPLTTTDTFVDSTIWSGHGTKNEYLYPNFDSSEHAAGWSHWGTNGVTGKFGQNTDPKFIYSADNKYSHWCECVTGSIADYLLYQSPEFPGGARSLQVILCMSDGSPVTAQKVYPTWNGRNGGLASSTWSDIIRLGDSKWYLCKAEGISQDGTNDLVGIYIKPGLKVYVDTMFLENLPVCTPITLTSRPPSTITFNLHRDYDLDWSKDWTIMFWKKPITGENRLLTGYNIDSLGAHNNSVGSGYLWTGKNTGSNVNVRPEYTFTPNKYFNMWRMVAIRKKGSIITVFDMGNNGAHRQDIENSTTEANHFVTQHGYDLNLGGWAGTVSYASSYYKDLIVSKIAFEDNTINEIYKTNISLIGRNLLIQNQIKEI